MKLKAKGLVELNGTKGIIIYGTKTDWNDIPQFNVEEGKYINDGKMFNVCFMWENDPIKVGEHINIALTQLLNKLTGD